MSEFLNIAGVEVERVAVEGITYTYPKERMSHEHLALATAVSSGHADGDIVMLPTDPERYPAQGAFFLASKPQSPEFIANMGNLVMGDPAEQRFERVLSTVEKDRRKMKSLETIAEHLEGGDTVANFVPHGPLLGIGVLHAFLHASLARMGTRFRSGIAISQGVTGLGRAFNGHDQPAPLTTALSWTCHKEWLVDAKTENANKSEYGQVVPASQSEQRNLVARSDIEAEQDVGGMFITVAPSATSYIIGKDGVRYSVAPTLGTLKLFAREDTYVSIAVGEILRATYERSSRLRQLSGNDHELLAQGDEIMRSMTAGSNATGRGSKFAFQGRRRLTII